MTVSENPVNTLPERCESCDGVTQHVVTVQLITEGDSADNSPYSREPYRIAECQRCGETQTLRMNDA
ncbi:DUF7835 family putative zinc beta-ribbon protein [Natrarchaeobius chitinivorans]|uniref:DUF7835 domain-containing protein n=1 Tax=Natrarchaeobius chitinivorans TaxID=1679083 RepID=A0A3N6MNH5_NATCH|nr:hypothetical protein [Natrarchaeobius chitinivorans]RQG96026.1 hypothetical protein EA473_07580 [Natrarchaeobius chitinivorans]